MNPKYIITILLLLICSGTASAAWDDATFDNSSPQNIIGRQYPIAALNETTGIYSILLVGEDGLLYTAATTTGSINFTMSSAQSVITDKREDGSHSYSQTDDGCRSWTDRDGIRHVTIPLSVLDTYPDVPMGGARQSRYDHKICRLLIPAEKLYNYIIGAWSKK